MSSPKIEDGGSAFPCEGGVYSGLRADPGMSLRDYFAAQVIANSPYPALRSFAIEAYRAADHMLEVRSMPLPLRAETIALERAQEAAEREAEASAGGA